MVYRLRKSEKLGLPPGVASYSGDISDQKIKIDVISFKPESGKKSYSHKRYDPDEIIDELDQISDDIVTWIDIQGIHNVDLMQSIADKFDFHPILSEDLLSPQQRPKLDLYSEHIAVFMRRVFDNSDTLELETDQIAMILGKNYILSFNELNDGKFKTVRDMISRNVELFLQHGNDFIFYVLIDYVIDSYFLEAENIEAEIDEIEDLIATHKFDNLNEQIRAVKKRVLGFKRIITPLREIPSKLRKLDISLFNQSTKPFLIDLEDHIFQLIDVLDTNREIMMNLKESYVSEMSTRMNEVMMTLTVVSSILLPLTFITSLYGMNFQYMPELSWKYAYLIVWLVMIGIAGSLTYFFRIKKWL